MTEKVLLSCRTLVHMGGGLTGVILLPFFMRKRHGAEEGIFYWAGCDEDVFRGNHSEVWSDGDCLYTPFYQLGWHFFGIFVISTWTVACSCLIFLPLWYFDLLRYHPDIEVRGIDIAAHGEPAYPLAATGHGWDNEGIIISSNSPNGSMDRYGGVGK